MNLGSIRKALTPLVTGGLGWAVLIINSAPTAITATEWVTGGVVLATALGVYAVSNEPA